MTVHPTAATGFANTADDYERSRPSYPPAAVDYLVEALDLRPGRTVVDVAAGTGKLTRLLVASGATVIAVEPIDEMRAVLAATTPGVTAMTGTAEQLPVDAADAITAAQAFHWFDGPAVLARFDQVLSDGGRFAVVYNQRTDAPGWFTEAMGHIRAYRDRVPQREDGKWRTALDASPVFALAEERSFDNPHRMARDEAIGRFRSLSWVGSLPAAEQRQVLGEVQAIIDRHPDSAGRAELVVPQHTTVWVWARR